MADRGRASRRGLGSLVVVGAAVVAALLLLPALIPSLNPFRERTIDRSQPALLKSLENLSEYRAATANLQVVVDVEQDTSLLPSFIKGERTLFVAAGSVDAAVDFSGLSRDPKAVQVSDDRRSATITLPAPTLSDPRIEPDRTRVYDRDRGVLDRVEDALSDRPGDEQPLYQLAEDKLREAAAAEPELRETAERNTRAMLEGMLRGLGFERVEVRFAQPVV
ncbi:MAG TPA: DUF4230 domain-containing protein [Solirubrobacteraceae bacterium]|nr:DUF4230 domain-containing protein [Solirubrobacteraceae bacterium]